MFYPIIVFDLRRWNQNLECLKKPNKPNINVSIAL